MRVRSVARTQYKHHNGVWDDYWHVWTCGEQAYNGRIPSNVNADGTRPTIGVRFQFQPNYSMSKFNDKSHWKLTPELVSQYVDDVLSLDDFGLTEIDKENLIFTWAPREYWYVAYPGLVFLRYLEENPQAVWFYFQLRQFLSVEHAMMFSCYYPTSYTTSDDHAFSYNLSQISSLRGINLKQIMERFRLHKEGKIPLMYGLWSTMHLVLFPHTLHRDMRFVSIENIGLTPEIYELMMSDESWDKRLLQYNNIYDKFMHKAQPNNYANKTYSAVSNF